MEDKINLLIRKFKLGSEAAFNDIYNLYFKKTYDFFYYRTFNVQAAEDLTSEAFTRFIQYADTFDEMAGTFDCWLYALKKNLLINHFRKEGKYSYAELQDIGEDCTGTVGTTVKEKRTESENNLEHLEKQGQWEDIMQLINSLPDEKKEILVMRIWEGLSYKEIARILNKSEASCKMCFSRIIKELRENLGVLSMISLLCLMILMQFFGTKG